MIMKILLDEQIRDVKYIKSVIDFTLEFLEGKYVVFHPNKVIKGLNNRSMMAIIEKKLLSSKQFELYDSNEVKKNTSDIFKSVNLEFSEGYVGKISYVEKKNEEIVIVLDPHNFSKDIKKIENKKIFFLNDYKKELNSNIGKWVVQQKFLKPEKLQKPKLDVPLPNIKLCDEYKQLQDELTSGESDKKPIFLKIGAEVAARNGYVRDNKIEKLNRKAIRHIFKYKGEDTIYISIDVEHGAIEVFNSKGKHQGEYGYKGELLSLSDKMGKHDIIIK